MTKQKLGPMPMVWPHPTMLVGADVDGKPDFAAVAWTGVAASEPPHLTIALQHQRYSLKGIFQNRAFSVNIPSARQLKEVDYCGMVSGRNTDKASDCGFTVFYGQTQGAPLIEECPINMECTAEHFLDLGSHFLVVGKIFETHISDDCLTEGRPDMMKVQPFVFGPGRYHRVGEALADAFSAGQAVKKGGR